MQKPGATRRRLEASERRGSRVVPLPLALIAVALPFIVAWAAPRDSRAREPRSTELTEPLRALARDTRVPAQPGAYVDVWGRPQPWEASWLERRGYVEPK